VYTNFNPGFAPPEFHGSAEVLDPSRIQPENKKKKEKGTGRRSPNIFSMLRIRIRDSVSFYPLDPGSGMGKKSKSGSGMNIPDHVSERLETIFWVKNTSIL
jgi:hypothetical protein